MQNLGLYIHIPYCKSKCIYCDFASYTLDEKHQDNYTLFLCKEIRNFAKNNDISQHIVDTIFFGGGTPSVLSNENFVKIIETIYATFICDITEFTIEVNPNSAEESKLELYKKYGVTRISYGVQTLNDTQLKTIGRLHNCAQAIRSVQLAQQIGFDVSVDMIIGLPGQDITDIEYFVKTFRQTMFNIYRLIF